MKRILPILAIFFFATSLIVMYAEHIHSGESLESAFFYGLGRAAGVILVTYLISLGFPVNKIYQSDIKQWRSEYRKRFGIIWVIVMLVTNSSYF